MTEEMDARPPFAGKILRLPNRPELPELEGASGKVSFMKSKRLQGFEPTQNEVGGQAFCLERNLGLICLCCAIFSIYVALNTAGSFRFREVPTHVNYNMLAEALVSGHLDLNVPIHPERLKHTNPADPFLPYPILIDLIIFHGKPYMIQAPLPAILRVPLRAVTGWEFPTGLAIVLAAFGCLLVFGWLLVEVRQAFFPDSPLWILRITWLSFAFSGTQLYMVSRPVVYHEAVVVGALFALSGTAVLFTLLTRPGPGFGRLFLAGLLFGAAVACRPTFVLYPTIWFVVIGLFGLKSKEPLGSIVRNGLALLFPVGFFGASLLLHNYLRFGDPFELGWKYHSPHAFIYAYVCLQNNLLRVAHVPYNLYDWFLLVPDLTRSFPYLEFSHVGFKIGDVLKVREKVGSVFFVIPMLLLSIPAVPLAFRAPQAQPLRVIITGCAAVSSAVFGFLLFHLNATSRYLYDFTPLLFVLVYYTLVTAWSVVVEQPRIKRLSIVVLGLLMTVQIVNGFALGFNGMLQYR